MEFNVTECEIGLPSTEREMEIYLGSGTLKGVGPSLAKSMVKFFGDRIFDIIENDPTNKSGGYGNLVVVQDKNGTEYLLTAVQPFFFSGTSNGKDGFPNAYISNERLGNRFRYIFSTSKTYINRNQFSYSSDLPIVKNIKKLLYFCISNNSSNDSSCKWFICLTNNIIFII